MLGAFACTLAAALLWRGSAAAAAPPAGHRDSSWFLGCCCCCGGCSLAARRVRDLDPVTCCVRCLQEGFRVAALSSERCYCGKQRRDLMVSRCFNTSPGGASEELRGERGTQSRVRLPVGSEPGNLALHQTEGPFLRAVRLSTSPGRVHAGKPFVLRLSGSLAGRPRQPTGISGLGEESLSYVTVQFLEASAKGQSSLQVKVQGDGSFAASSDRVFETPGRRETRVDVSNLVSKLSSTLHLSVLPPSPNAVVVSMVPGPLGVPSCVPFPVTACHAGAARAAYVGDSVTLQARVLRGPAAEFHWRFANGSGEENEERTSMRTSCSSVTWTFKTEGVHKVSVNASGADGWTQDTICVAAVRLAVSDLSVSVGENPLSAGASVSVGVELFTAARPRLLRLLLRLTAEGASDCDGGASDGSEHHTGETSDWHLDCDNSNNGNALRLHHSCHGNGASRPLAAPLIHTSHQSSCRLRLHLCCRLPAAAGCYRLAASVFSRADPASALLAAVLPRALVVRTPALRPSGKWPSVVATQSEFRLEVAGCVSSTDPGVVWTFTLGDATLLNRTTEGWSINASLPIAGRYHLRVKASGPISCASLHTRILAQDPVGELFLNAPSVRSVHLERRARFSRAAGSSVTASRSSEIRAENPVPPRSRRAVVRVEGKPLPSPRHTSNPTWQPPTSRSSASSLTDSAVRIFAASRVYATNTDVTFLAEATGPDPVDLLWYFGDSKSTRTTSRVVTKRYYAPGRYDVFVVLSRGRTTFTSEAFPIVVQSAVKLNRLVHRASVLQNRTVTVSCRVDGGTDVDFLWSFGDGAARRGRGAERHVYRRTGEFRIEVTASNLVSSASLSSLIFVVERPCQPPPVKNMGPLRLRVRRHEAVRLGVAYESEVDCEVSRGLSYSWTLLDSAGRIFPLTVTDTRRQSLLLPGHLLNYDTYTAVARVQVLGSVVYSNYSVRVQVTPSPPVASISGGTNIFINNGNIAMVTLDAQRSYDPDFPMNPISFSWTCEPVSSIATSCFRRRVATSSSLLSFPATSLKPDFDQFRFTLAVRSGGRSASSETFVTLTPNVIGKVAVDCARCRGDRVAWDQSFSVSASCEDCGVSPELVRFSWSLHLVNVSSKPLMEVPFCYAADLSAPSAIIEAPPTSSQTPGTTGLNPPAGDSSLYTSSPVRDFAASPTGRRADGPHAPRRRGVLANVAGGTEAEVIPRVFGPMKPIPESFPVYPRTGLTDREIPASSAHDNVTTGSGEDEPLYKESNHFIRSDVISEQESSADGGFSFPAQEADDVGEDYDVTFPVAEEGDPGISAGRPTGVDGESSSLGDTSVFDPASREDEGSNLVDSRPPVVTKEPTLLDLPRQPVDGGLFESYTHGGISSPLLSFRPFSLRPGSRYMLEVTAKAQNRLLGRAQLFLRTDPAPTGMTCQVQPVEGVELYTHFSIFCTSGREDLLYEYSFSVGNNPPRILYQGTNFQHYFSLPSGNHGDDYKVTIYTKIRSGVYGTSTGLCPVTVRVQPSFLRDVSSPDPDSELSESGLRNLSALVQLGNSVEVRNYVSILAGVLNRLSLDAQADERTQRRLRSALICTVCRLESSDQASMVDGVCILNDLLRVTSQVTLASVRRVTAHIQAVSRRLPEPGAPGRYHLDQRALDALVSVLSYSLQAVITGRDLTPEAPGGADPTPGSDPPPADGCASDPHRGVSIETSLSAQRATQLAADVLQAVSDLVLSYILFHQVQEQRVSAGLVSLFATRPNQTAATVVVVGDGAATFHVPADVIRRLVGRSKCVLGLLTQLPLSPYDPGRVSGPVVDLSLHECSTRRKIPVGSLVRPITAELRQPARNRQLQATPAPTYVLLRGRVNYHSFNITQEHLRQAIQLRVEFAVAPTQTSPIMLLFRMHERPNPSMHHLHRIHQWQSAAACITLPPSYLNAAGVGHVALLNADYGKPPGRNRPSSLANYSLTVVASQCLSWDGHQGAWTPLGCRTQLADATAAVNCSCRHMRPLTVARQQIRSRHDTADLDPLLSAPADVTVLAALLLCLCLFIPPLVACRRADAVSEASRRVHFLPDNPPGDPHLYAVTVHTGCCSAAVMSAKVYIVLHGADGISQTRELQAPGCTLFRRSSQDTFILSTAESLGPVWGVHVWHDAAGPSPTWDLSLVQVSEVDGTGATGPTWLFVCQCWLAVNRGDGQVERMLRACTQGIGFAKTLSLKLSAYLADFHIWMCVCACPRPHPFTHTQRLCVCVLLLLAYACVNAVIISQMDEPPPFELGIIGVPAVAVTTGILSMTVGLPAATLISFLFRLHEAKLMESEHADGGKTDLHVCLEDDGLFEARLSWRNLQRWAQEAWRKKHQVPPAAIFGCLTLFPSLMVLFHYLGSNQPSASRGDPENKDASVVDQADAAAAAESAAGGSLLISGEADRGCPGKAVVKGPSGGGVEEGSVDPAAAAPPDRSRGSHVEPRGRRTRPRWRWCQRLAWTLCLLLSLSCLLLSAALGRRFSSGKALLWMHSLLFSLLSCVFLVQPAAILAAAVTVALRCRGRPDFCRLSRSARFDVRTLRTHKPAEQLGSLPQEGGSDLEELLRARRRARFLRLVRPPTPARLRKVRASGRREALVQETLRDFSICASMLLLMLLITSGSSNTDRRRLNKAVTQQFIGGQDDTFMSIRKFEDWWEWTRGGLLDLLYMNASAAAQSGVVRRSHVLVGAPVLWRLDACAGPQCHGSSVTLHCLHSLSGSTASTYPHSDVTVPMATPHRTWGLLGCRSAAGTAVGLGHTKSDATFRMKLLLSGGRLARETVALRVQFTFYSAAPDLFTTVTLSAERGGAGGGGILLPSARVESARVYRARAARDYVVMVCQLLFLLASLLHICLQVYTVGQQGLMGYLRAPRNWLGVAVQVAALACHARHIARSAAAAEAAEQLQRSDGGGRVDVGPLASAEQHVRSLCGVMLLLLTVKCASLLGVNKMVANAAALVTRPPCRLVLPMISGFILLAAVDSLQNLICHHGDLRGLLQSGRGPTYFRAFSLPCALVWTAAMVGVASTSARGPERLRSSEDAACTAGELAGYVWRRLCEVTGQQRPTWTSLERRTRYLEEFECVVDELLLRLDAVTNSRRHREDAGPQSSAASPASRLLRDPPIGGGGRSSYDSPESSASPVMELWRAEHLSDALERHAGPEAKSSGGCMNECSGNAGERRREDEAERGEVMLVEVLVHEEP